MSSPQWNNWKCNGKQSYWQRLLKELKGFPNKTDDTEKSGATAQTAAVSKYFKILFGNDCNAYYSADCCCKARPMFVLASHADE